MIKVYIFRAYGTDYEADGFTEWDARANLREDFGEEIEEEATLVDIEYYDYEEEEYDYDG